MTIKDTDWHLAGVSGFFVAGFLLAGAAALRARTATATEAQAAPAPAAGAAIELVQSVPAETDWADPQLRYAKDVWVELADHAQKSLDLAQFYASASKKGPELEPVIAALERAGKRGVKIRFLLSNELLKSYRTT
ncbi:MAG TPA: hypothetical protein VL588_04220, partial [Bdellovibrionota bacterium]|nr:hypothetical protein [Bdellovibrionota bacterium]